MTQLCCYYFLTGGRISYHDKESQPVVTSELADNFYYKAQISNLYLPQEPTTAELPAEMYDPTTAAELEGSCDLEPEGSMDSETEGSTVPDPSGGTVLPSNEPLVTKAVDPATQHFTSLSLVKGLAISAKQLKSRKHYVLSTDALSLFKCKTPYLVHRANACGGLTVDQCIKMKYKHADGSIKKIKIGDLVYTSSCSSGCGNSLNQCSSQLSQGL